MSTIYEVLAPLPGTFYHRESPAAPPVVSIGQSIEVGAPIGLIEVMKMFNHITSDYSGVVVEICVESEEPVDIGQVLLRIEVSE